MLCDGSRRLLPSGTGSGHGSGRGSKHQRRAQAWRVLSAGGEHQEPGDLARQTASFLPQRRVLMRRFRLARAVTGPSLLSRCLGWSVRARVREDGPSQTRVGTA